jgi:hypothetical protein
MRAPLVENGHAKAKKDGASQRWIPEGAVPIPDSGFEAWRRENEVRKRRPKWQDAPGVEDSASHRAVGLFAGIPERTEPSNPHGIDEMFGVLLIALCGLGVVVLLVHFLRRFFRWLSRHVSARHASESRAVNRKQRTCLWAGIIVFVLMGLFPPGYYASGYHEYTFLFLPLIQVTGCRIDIHRLFVQWIMVAVVTGGLILTFRGSAAKE